MSEIVQKPTTGGSNTGFVEILTREEELTVEYMAWLAAQEAAGHPVPRLSADEALVELIAPPPGEREPWRVGQIDWLVDFIDRWEVAR